jgi:hypothetical protein
MKLKILASFIATALLTVLVIPFHLAAQEQEDKKEQKTKHFIIRSSTWVRSVDRTATSRLFRGH